MSKLNKSSTPIATVRWDRKIAIIDVTGDIDLERSSDFQQALLIVLDKKPTRVIVNLAGVPYMDSSGVASLVKLLGRARKLNITVALVSLTERVRSIFEITRLDGIFEIHGTEQEALA